VIRTFADTDTQRLFQRARVDRFYSFERVALRKLLLLDAITSLTDLKGPGFSLEALRHDRTGQYSIRVNERWRICFAWMSGDAYDVAIVDYH
jgi:proteic killer suppression protein